MIGRHLPAHPRAAMARLTNEWSPYGLRGTGTAVPAGMDSRGLPHVRPSAARRALISLVADIAWAARNAPVARKDRSARDEAMSLLARVDRGDRSATQRAMQLVSAAHGRAA